MTDQTLLHKRLTLLQDTTIPAMFAACLIGLEKEQLRVSSSGEIAQSLHPAQFGSALTHPYITTDYSEALLELITPPSSGGPEALDFLRNLHIYVYANLDNEYLWASSMPCIVSGEKSIQIAQYGSSNSGKMKSIYRQGLAHRYGRMMQVIAGIHYNYSLPESFWTVYQATEKQLGRPSDSNKQNFISTHYLAMIRNIQRYGWLIPYLFGASPAVCKSFMDGIEKILQPFDDYSYYGPYATSLRLADIGYQNHKEGETGVKANYDDLDAYTRSLEHAINTPYPAYQSIGVKQNGTYHQLNCNILQIENEYYSTVRPKQVTQALEKPIHALNTRGVRYVELRSLDINVLHPLGIDLEELYFLEVFVLYCLLQDSPLISDTERVEIDSNQNCVAHRGRQPGLHLKQNGTVRELKSWMNEIFEQLESICTLLDNEQKHYSHAVLHFKQRVTHPELTPSALILEEMQQNNESFYAFNMRKTQEHQQYFLAQSLTQARLDYFDKLSRTSVQQQRHLEQQDTQAFDDFLQHYFKQPNR